MRSNSPSGGMKDHPPHKRSRGEEGVGDGQGGGVKSPSSPRGHAARVRLSPRKLHSIRQSQLGAGIEATGWLGIAGTGWLGTPGMAG